MLRIELFSRTDPDGCSRTVDGDQVMLGYVPRYLAHDVRKLFELCQPDLVQMFVDRVNSDAPLQQRLLCRMQARWPKGFRPCSDEAFQPIPQSLPELCSI